MPGGEGLKIRTPRPGTTSSTNGRTDQEIDAAVALMMAIGRAMLQDEDAKGMDVFRANPIFG
jgi:phage terminase large subunit-like protein